MKKQILSFLVLLSVSIAQASGGNSTLNLNYKLLSDASATTQSKECTFTAAVALNVVGQTASISCTSTQAACSAAINDVVTCIKLAKNRLQKAIGL